MTADAPALVAAAAGVGFGHAVLPDHWVPLGMLSRTNRYPIRRVARLAGLAAGAHVLLSVILGAVIVVVGLQLRSTVAHAQDAIVGGLLIATGIGFVLLEAMGRGHTHGQHDGSGHAHAYGHPHHDHDHHRRGAFIVSFGAAASPDLTILPVFLAATTAGAGVAVGTVLVFAAVTIATIVGLTLAATIGGYGLRSEWLEQWGNSFTAVVLIVVGALVLTGTI